MRSLYLGILNAVPNSRDDFNVLFTYTETGKHCSSFYVVSAIRFTIAMNIGSFKPHVGLPFVYQKLIVKRISFQIEVLDCLLQYYEQSNTCNRGRI